MGKLTPEQVDKYFNEDLPYRNRILIAHKTITEKGPYYGDIAILQACFEASLITGRIYLNVLGISKNKNDELVPVYFRDDDINAEDLGGKLYDISNLTQDEKDLLIDFLKMADKGAAHLTLPFNHPWHRTHNAIELILLLIKKNIYGHTGRNIKY